MFYEKKKRNQTWLISFIFFVFGGCNSPKTDKSLERSASTYFTEIPIVKYSKGQVPCVSVRLQGEDLVMELDLGFCGGLDVSPKLIERLKEIKYSRSREVHVVTGKEYEQNIYFVKRLDIGQSFFTGKISVEDGYHEDRNRETVISSSQSDSYSRDDGRIGWHLFATCALLVDFKQSKIAIADSFETFKNYGYFQGEYANSSLFLDRELPEIEVSTSLGNLRCVVDTGATMSIIHREVEGFDVTRVEEISGSFLNQYPLKLPTFRPFWIKLPVAVQAILGMDFFLDHLVVLDFKAARIYVQRYE